MALEMLKIQRFPSRTAFYLLFLLCFFCPVLWASQDAMVIADKAIIYSDKEMTSPLGYVVRGKKLKVGEVPRNKAQVYPIVVSGRVGYVRVIDVTTEKESMDSDRLVAERFTRSTKSRVQAYYTLSYYSFNSTLTSDEENGEIRDGDALRWDGLSFKGAAIFKKDWEFQILFNYMQTGKGDEMFRTIEFGAGGAYRLINQRKFILKAEAHLLTVPYARYEVDKGTEVNSWGFTAGAALNAHYMFDENWGMEGFFGAYYTRIMEFEAEAPFEDFAPTFVGNRIGIGLNYTY